MSAAAAEAGNSMDTSPQIAKVSAIKNERAFM
jgi:hypothetical protein